MKGKNTVSAVAPTERKKRHGSGLFGNSRVESENWSKRLRSIKLVGGEWK